MANEQGQREVDESPEQGNEPQAEKTAAPRGARARWIRRGLGLALGAGAGVAYYSFVGCNSGGCPIWQDPVVSSGFGATIGVLAIW
jgi:hypothetical protein